MFFLAPLFVGLVTVASTTTATVATAAITGAVVGAATKGLCDKSNSRQVDANTDSDEKRRLIEMRNAMKMELERIDKLLSE